MTSPTGVTLLLPWLDPKIGPNGRVTNWAARRKRLKPHKEAATLVAIEAYKKLGRTLTPPVKASWIFVPPDKHERDLANLTGNPCCKAAVDACVLEGLLEDDTSTLLTWGEPQIWTAYPKLGGPGIVLLLDEVTA